MWVVNLSICGLWVGLTLLIVGGMIYDCMKKNIIYETIGCVFLYAACPCFFLKTYGELIHEENKKNNRV